MLKKFIILTFMVCIVVSPMGVSAQKVNTSVEEDDLLLEVEEDATDSDKLREEYILNAFGIGGDVPVLFANIYAAFDNLEEKEQEYYRIIEEQVKDVAKNGGSTIFSVPESVIGIEDGDIDAFLEDNGIVLGEVTKEEINDFLAKLYSVDIVSAYNAALADMPYEFYWKGRYYQYRTTFGIKKWKYNTETDMITSVEELSPPRIQLRVASAYREDGDLLTVKSDVSVVNEAVSRAKSVAAQGSSKNSDYAALAYYKDWICENTSYHYRTPEDDIEPGDPWQLVYVFDGDPSTKSSCEGYGKAFKYLCDETDFRSGTQCITVSGTLDDENHMWNIVNLKGNNYLVDITNTDESMVAPNGELFLAGSSKGDPYKGYILSTDIMDLEYIYSETDIQGGRFGQIDLYGVEWLTLSEDSFVPDKEDLDDGTSRKPSGGKKGDITPEYLAGAPKSVISNVMSFNKASDKSAFVKNMSLGDRMKAAEYSYPVFQESVIQDLSEPVREIAADASLDISGKDPASDENVIIIKTDKWMSFNLEALKAIELCPLDVRVIYKDGPVENSFTIPAAYQASTLADANGYAGFRYIKSVVSTN